MNPLVDEWAYNPFFVLGVPPHATDAEINRAAQRITAELTVGIAGAEAFQTPFGPRQRTAEVVREALNFLRDPTRRFSAELAARLPSLPPEPERPPQVLDAPNILGLGGLCGEL